VKIVSEERFVSEPGDTRCGKNAGRILFGFAPIEERTVVTAFDGGAMTSEAGGCRSGKRQLTGNPRGRRAAQRGLLRGQALTERHRESLAAVPEIRIIQPRQRREHIMLRFVIASPTGFLGILALVEGLCLR